MPPGLFLMLIATVILAAGVTVALFHAAGWPVGAAAQGWAPGAWPPAHPPRWIHRRRPARPCG